MNSPSVPGGLDHPHDLRRFLEAQDGVHAQALAELRRGSKRSHWMWFVFPQLAGLGLSSTANRFGIRSLEEARAYLTHPVLGARLLACAAAMLSVDGRSATAILGIPDDLKLRSCATLFALVAEPGSVFEQLLATYYGGDRDRKTLRLLGLEALD